MLFENEYLNTRFLPQRLRGYEVRRTFQVLLRSDSCSLQVQSLCFLYINIAFSGPNVQDILFIVGVGRAHWQSILSFRCGALPGTLLSGWKISISITAGGERAFGA